MRFVLRSRTLPAIHEHGTPVMHIPARPVIRPALSQASVRAETEQPFRRIASKKAGEVSVTYAAGASSSSVSADLADLTETDFGMQLLGLIRLYSMTRCVP